MLVFLVFIGGLRGGGSVLPFVRHFKGRAVADRDPHAKHRNEIIMRPFTGTPTFNRSSTQLAITGGSRLGLERTSLRFGKLNDFLG